jgi:hypothetical protein
MMFTEFYRETFATLGISLTNDDCCELSEIENAEKRLGIKIPLSLKEYYLLSGREKRINQFHNRLRPPEKWFVDGDNLVFMEENQWVVYWGVPVAKAETKDSGVFQGVNFRDKGIDWHSEHESCATFLNVMAIWHASYGGAVSNTAVGYVDEVATRKKPG